MAADDEPTAENLGDITSLPIRNDLHYDMGGLGGVDWSKRGDYMQRKHGITPQVADDALADPNRVSVVPDYNSTSGKSVRIIGYSVIAEDVITVIVVEHDGTEYGVNGWSANAKDRRIYNQHSYDATQGEADEHQDR